MASERSLSGQCQKHEKACYENNESKEFSQSLEGNENFDHAIQNESILNNCNFGEETLEIIDKTAVRFSKRKHSKKKYSDFVLDEEGLTDLHESCNENDLESAEDVLFKETHSDDDPRKKRIRKRQSLTLCEECGKQFKKRSVLFHHMKEDHQVKAPFKCFECNDLFVEFTEWKEHEEIHKSKQFKCTYCEKRFCTKTKLNVHLRVHTGERPYKCEMCPKAFATHSTFNTHMKMHTGEKLYTCRVCHKKFVQKSGLRSHLLTHEEDRPHECSLCSKTFALPIYLKRHMYTHTGERPWKCTICTKSFAKKWTLDEHVKVHTKDRKFPCNYCDKYFYGTGDLKVHERIHTGEKPYPCPDCKKSFATLTKMKVHQRVHTGEKPYKCNFCGKGFATTSTRQVHERIHTGVKPYVCSYCGKGFTQYGNLDNHIKTHTGEKPFQCTECGKTFSTRTNYENHVKIHTKERPFKCQHCDQAFLSQFRLDAHVRKHTGEKKYKCSICQKQFDVPSKLKIHFRSHDAPRIYACNHCNKTFGNKAGFVTHLKTHGTLLHRHYQCTMCSTSFQDKAAADVHMQIHAAAEALILQMQQEPLSSESGEKKLSDVKNELQAVQQVVLKGDGNEAETVHLVLIHEQSSVEDVKSLYEKEFAMVATCQEEVQLTDNSVQHVILQQTSETVQTPKKMEQEVLEQLVLPQDNSSNKKLSHIGVSDCNEEGVLQSRLEQCSQEFGYQYQIGSTEFVQESSENVKNQDNKPKQQVFHILTNEQNSEMRVAPTFLQGFNTEIGTTEAFGDSEIAHQVIIQDANINDGESAAELLQQVALQENLIQNENSLVVFQQSKLNCDSVHQTQEQESSGEPVHLYVIQEQMVVNEC